MFAILSDIHGNLEALTAVLDEIDRRKIEYVVCLFFFSSRRRHTRWTGDWSSDVCSSDLARSGWTLAAAGPDAGGAGLGVPAAGAAHRRGVCRDRLADPRERSVSDAGGSRSRSEERRVGNVGRSGWWRYDVKYERCKCRSH